MAGLHLFREEGIITGPQYVAVSLPETGLAKEVSRINNYRRQEPITIVSVAPHYRDQDNHGTGRVGHIGLVREFTFTY